MCEAPQPARCAARPRGAASSSRFSQLLVSSSQQPRRSLATADRPDSRSRRGGAAVMLGSLSRPLAARRRLTCEQQCRAAGRPRSGRSACNYERRSSLTGLGTKDACALAELRGLHLSCTGLLQRVRLHVAVSCRALAHAGACHMQVMLGLGLMCFQQHITSTSADTANLCRFATRTTYCCMWPADRWCLP